jgi:hypothetical protein
MILGQSLWSLSFLDSVLLLGIPYFVVGWVCKCRSVGTLSLLASLTREIIKASDPADSEEETWTSKALDILLDTWTVLLQVIPTLPPQNILKYAFIKVLQNRVLF